MFIKYLVPFPSCHFDGIYKVLNAKSLIKLIALTLRKYPYLLRLLIPLKLNCITCSFSKANISLSALTALAISVKYCRSSSVKLITKFGRIFSETSSAFTVKHRPSYVSSYPSAKKFLQALNTINASVIQSVIHRVYTALLTIGHKLNR